LDSILNDRDQQHLVQLIKTDRQQSVELLTENFNKLGLKTVSAATIYSQT